MSGIEKACRCEAEVYSGTSMMGRWVKCSRTAKHHEGGKDYCGIHAPSKVEARAAKKRAAEDRKAAHHNQILSERIASNAVIGVALRVPEESLPPDLREAVKTLRNVRSRRR